ncbi:EAL domain-containing protein [Bowmanella pacifica]|uniref:Diguanylate cyclase/phosphodiesterase with PAS/PAC sensor(S) n=1 Tax=Bowmanella pacifica TaxID=502051 RepID=A0A917Z423_9ALTE|nr:EAL domain-containing protein [Bowmanella pacifica]GGO74214.1 hypothetical protein GCM10010982_36520 [Bowmanella pacifica]
MQDILGPLLNVGHTEPTVAELASRDLVTCPPDTAIRDVAKLMQSHQVSCVLVKDNEDIVGIWTESDAKSIDFDATHHYQTPVSKLMSYPVIQVQGNTLLNDATSLMLKKQIRRLLVTDKQNRPLGLLTQTDIVKQQRIEFYLALRDVGSTLIRPPLVLDASLSLAEGVTAMNKQGVDAALVATNGHAQGIVTERDLIKLIASASKNVSLGELAHKPLLTVKKTCTLLQAVDILKENNFRHLAVSDEHEQLCGLLSFSDILLNVEHTYVAQLKEALRARDAALRTSTDYLRLAQKVIDASLDGIMITDVNGVIESVNPSFSMLTGYSADEAIGRKPDLLSSGLHEPHFYKNLWETLLSQGQWQGEIWNKRKNGEVYPQWLSITAIRGEQGEIGQFAGIFSDISERKRQEKQIHQLAYIDELTGLANRRLFMDRLHLGIANAHRHHHNMAVLFLDLDLFKRINDTLGHQAGDQALKEVAHRLLSTVREGESVARIGGDEFTILIPEIDKATSLECLAQRLITQFDAPIRIKGQDFFLTASIGISMFPKDGQSSEQLIKHADLAMYQAKNAGRNQYCFYQASAGQQTADELRLEQGLRLALQQQSLKVLYQPKVDLRSGQLTGVEALVRWHDPTLGQVSPVDFIPLAEKLGLIGLLSEQVIYQVCEDIRTARLPEVPVSINISVLHLITPDFCERLLSILQQAQVSPEQIELELTESCLIPAQADTTLGLLTKLRQLGFRLSIDDFGTGYSSLSYLRRLPINVLKIDRSFIRELPDNNEDSQITLAIIAMAKALNLDVIAEGIESSAQRDFLLGSGCQVGQGYLYSPAVEPEKLKHWIN